jgi:hypothetical protein
LSGIFLAFAILKERIIGTALIEGDLGRSPKPSFAAGPVRFRGLA